jgi:putative FmdB family regulatory protein
MPLFEYECRGCGHHFEYLTRDGQTPACPSCRGDNLQKLLSVFAVGADGGGRKAFDMPASGGACGQCGDPRGPGSCSMN